MRFNFDAYEKVYPETAPAVSVESAVDTFKPTESEAKATEKKPTESEAKATEKKPGDDVMASVQVQDEPETKPQETAPEVVPKGGTNG